MAISQVFPFLWGGTCNNIKHYTKFYIVGIGLSWVHLIFNSQIIPMPNPYLLAMLEWNLKKLSWQYHIVNQIVCSYFYKTFFENIVGTCFQGGNSLKLGLCICVHGRYRKTLGNCGEVHILSCMLTKEWI
jgi:hypothetical protein